MFVETHVHTAYSKGHKVVHEGVSMPEEIIDAAMKMGIGALAITDHNSFDGVASAMKAGRKKGMIIIPGEEVSSADGHIVALGTSELIKPGKSAEETIDMIREQAGIAISSHPFDIGRHGLKSKAALCDAVEAFNAMNLDRLANQRSYKWIKERGLIAVAGSDAHNTEMLGLGMLVLPDNYNSIDSILKAVKKGKHSYTARYAPITVTMRWVIERMQASHDDVMEYIMQNYKGPKKYASKWLLKSTKYSPGKIDILYQLMAYAGISSSIIYSALRGGRIVEM